MTAYRNNGYESSARIAFWCVVATIVLVAVMMIMGI